jgi:SAM-dependent methyltransferase
MVAMRFGFGKNWQSFSRTALTQDRISQAGQAFDHLFEGIELQGRSFLDIGFGQGLSLVRAADRGAIALGIDIDPDNLEALAVTARAMRSRQVPQARAASILDPAFVQGQKAAGGFDVVHSWGVLHHTGHMAQAFDNACALVKDGGYLVCSIYNRHWSSPLWKAIKYAYNKSPAFLQRVFIGIFYSTIYLAKWLVTGKNPKQKGRGMDFYHDVVDWVGGYPYEYASIQEIQDLVCPKGFECIRVQPARVPTGCNEFVFRRVPSSLA